MAKKKIKDVIEEILEEFLCDKGLILWNVEFVKEAKEWFLRIYIDKAIKGDFLGISECEEVSRFLSEKLDEIDPIEQNYYMEVSSPGMDRELITNEHYNRYIGELVDVKMYKALNGNKEITGKLVKNDDEEIVLNDDGNDIIIPKKEIAKTRLTVVF